MFPSSCRSDVLDPLPRGNCRHDGLGCTYVVVSLVARHRRPDWRLLSSRPQSWGRHVVEVPHDRQDMTSISIRQYVLGLYKQLGLREKDITKVQTGGPDGDLGSSTHFDRPFSLRCCWGS